ncbi:cobyrinate a,c-diamide synthase [Tenacibaculum finnmarkense]|uniref:Cobyrinate a,c-diamide synthase n=1 Tax=Tenacibaculum finnmarkense genomovar finnmarkense TaxID=1458503 RepID=A0AAP1REY7_9FLAO|nr:cobyrinate a,c-diamide synthase [Tenacibaculum finnmarkense]MBE7652513.1 cobyrinate a,c-diamide synthase [Tenacibaculum finnmarkense genomovar finnmarkense]MBE7694677.1 cobyrinate a,c-diamide synthase [Tenacibaculum finnmarkense genomovar finnmarkense]MCD8427002.1 cobyrinate a,c-diamide synthase [Tenacibaculum finnmarkense genomovar finnmarkense]MCG8731138.1 cobyrinate a,c-diamide synthase [Tenacibaculum finnmarkense]MCG8752518.1 cobyrinate a,c-diamide synthase [Tenacibaculum finnmarkense]
MTKQLIISAPSSNAGKTTLTLGLLRLFKRKNYAVQPFKVGPDYIDPKFHQLACSNVGVNLDLFMMPQNDINNNLHFYGKDAEINCIEGVMGLFDGAKKDQGSTAEMAKKLKTPVLMVIDAKAVAYSVAPLIQGFVNFDKEIQIMGVVFNRVGSERHYKMLKEACDDIGVHCFGYLSNLKNIEIPSRHLGLNIQEIEKFDTVINQIADELEKTIDWKAILEASKEIKPISVSSEKIIQPKKIKFAVAKDEAFNFMYPQSISAMEALGTVEFFSPIKDAEIPDCDFIYFAGGYPESYLKELSSNTKMLASIQKFAENNGQIYAECGGMMYLGKTIISENKTAFKMVGVFDFEATIADKKLHLGYRTSKINEHIFKGHEFHYSSLVNDNETSINATITNARDGNTTTKIYKKNKVMASYVHHYFGTSELLLQLINEINTTI